LTALVLEGTDRSFLQTAGASSPQA
jgi:hypothetical protein